MLLYPPAHLQALTSYYTGGRLLYLLNRAVLSESIRETRGCASLVRSQGSKGATRSNPCTIHVKHSREGKINLLSTVSRKPVLDKRRADCRRLVVVR